MYSKIEKIAFILNVQETQKLNVGEPDTSGLLMRECLKRNIEVYVFTNKDMFLQGNIPMAYVSKVNLNLPTALEHQERVSLTEFDVVVQRTNPPVDMEYIFATYMLDYLEGTSTLVINSPAGIRKANEKVYVNNFPEYSPTSLVASDIRTIKGFLNEHRQIIIKPLNNYGGNGIFCLKNDDVNTNSILETATYNQTLPVMVQQYLPDVKKGDKRIALLGGEPIACINRLSYDDDFRANMTKGGFLEKAEITEKDREICAALAPKLLQDGIYFAGIDIIGDKIIEINVTSPGFFIRKLNPMFNICLEALIVNYVEKLWAEKRVGVSNA